MTGHDIRIDEKLDRIGLPKPDQIGFVVRDLERAMALYDPVFGPFHIVDFGAQQASYRGAAPTPYDMKFAFGRIHDLEIELIEWVSGDTPHRDFLEQGSEGVHHLRFRVEELESWEARLASAGYERVWYDRLSPDTAYAYYERADDPLLIELLQYPATKALAGA